MISFRCGMKSETILSPVVIVHFIDAGDQDHGPGAVQYLFPFLPDRMTMTTGDRKALITMVISLNDAGT